MCRLAGVLLAIGAAACVPHASSPTRSGTVTLATATAPPSMPRPARGRMAAAVADNLACERCHSDVAAEWRASLHARADLEPSYRRAFAREPMAFCRACHAPEAIATEPEPAAIAALGVGCVTCHVVDGGAILAAPSGAARQAAPHAITRDARFASADACAACHEFAFPAKRGRADGELMQSTVREHARSAAPARACAACHMPRGAAGLRSHAFATTRDPGLMRASLDVVAARVSPTAVRITLTPRAVGHALPTGDLFRRLELCAEAAGADHASLGGATRHLARHWRQKPGGIGRELVGDDRLEGAARTIELEIGEVARGRAIEWRVAYQRVAHPNGIDDDDVELDGELTLASGRFEP